MQKKQQAATLHNINIFNINRTNLKNALILLFKSNDDIIPDYIYINYGIFK